MHLGVIYNVKWSVKTQAELFQSLIHLVLIDICSILDKMGLKLAISSENDGMNEGLRTFKLNLVTEIV